MTMQLNGTWDAATFFESLTLTNILALDNGFTFCRVSGLEGFEEAVGKMQGANAFVCVSDIADGYMELNNTPRTRRVKTVFFAMRHAAEDMKARSECMDIMRELFRQFMSRLLLEKVRLEQNCIYLDPRISFNEIDRYFFSGAAGAYFQIAVDVYTDLRVKDEEWNKYRDVWLMGIKENVNRVPTIRILHYNLGIGLSQAVNIVNSAPVIIYPNVLLTEARELADELIEAGAIVKIVPYGSKP